MENKIMVTRLANKFTASCSEFEGPLVLLPEAVTGHIRWIRFLPLHSNSYEQFNILLPPTSRSCKFSLTLMVSD